MKTKILYRPVGEKEMLLIIESNYKRFPPRLEWQPIFYPVLNEDYASEIAEKWNTRDEAGNFLGFVTKFEVLEEIANQYPSENVGARNHNELWIPSEELNAFNKAIIGNIEVTKVFIGKDFKKPANDEVENLLLNIKKLTMTNKGMAKDTLEILAKKYYINEHNEKINIENELEICKKETVLFSSEQLSEMTTSELLETDFETKIEIWNCSSLKAILQLSEEENQEKIMCLNFASAKNPGGGFINGAEAQEESLARTSALYETQLQAWDYYTVHRAMESCFYTDMMIYSPKVPVFRKDKGELLSKPVLCNFITSPAVNAGVVKRQEPERIDEILGAMDVRMDKIFALALHKGNETLILGAWGCGVFKNDPKEIAELFRKHLQGKYKNKFKRVVFAILTKKEEMIRPFEEII
ncbi:TIGR02452 family protein [Chryseobacterium formosus]|uniref:TIGR02452 family protein n=1 Tax=Chryseobacterium formosus TaxID=1537363 RepID=A0ABT3XNF4_9FLAO|nr:TIGR02452 family protein [Chryseobacterium formosus]MCX8522672.1 TIGR02452 family protein [Chryseobacterium formosus]